MLNSNSSANLRPQMEPNGHLLTSPICRPLLSHASQWVFFACQLVTYWKQSKFMLRMAFNKMMACTRFDIIWRYLHLTNLENIPQPSTDRLAKLHRYLHKLNNAFKAQYAPYSAVTSDETMIKFKGRFSFRHTSLLNPSSGV